MLHGGGGTVVSCSDHVHRTAADQTRLLLLPLQRQPEDLRPALGARNDCYSISRRHCRDNRCEKKKKKKRNKDKRKGEKKERRTDREINRKKETKEEKEETPREIC